MLRIYSILLMILGLVSTVTCVWGIWMYNLTAMHVFIEKPSFRNITLSTLEAERFFKKTTVKLATGNIILKSSSLLLYQS